MGDGLVLNRIETFEEVNVGARRAFVEKGSHGPVTLPAACDALSRLRLAKAVAPERTQAPASERHALGAQARRPGVRSPLNARF